VPSPKDLINMPEDDFVNWFYKTSPKSTAWTTKRNRCHQGNQLLVVEVGAEKAERNRLKESCPICWNEIFKR
jgi:hypothetical protein